MSKINHTPTVQDLKRFARDNRGLVLALLKATAYAQLKREQVDAYVKPIFDSFNFQKNLFDLTGPVESPKDLYLCEDNRLDAFYAACDKAHREHGFKGEEGYCPALVAESLVIDAENALIDQAKPLFGVEHHQLTTANRRKYLDLLIGSCLVDERKAA